MPHEHDHHDGSLSSDLAHVMSRRAMLLLAGSSGLLAACDGGLAMGQAEANVIAAEAVGGTCIRLPAETSGPFPADGTNRKSLSTVNVLDKSGIIRADIRPSFDGLSDVAEGVPLTLELHLADVSRACAPLAGHVIYIWQCDAGGSYSIYERTDSNNLRGAAVTDAAGVARFTSIVPGCYPGRWPHIHFEVFADTAKASRGDQSLLTSQFALPKAACATVYAGHPAYAKSPAHLAGLSLATDGIFANNTAEQLAAQTLVMTGDSSKGYAAVARVGITGSTAA